jgi:hypothetical protein
LTGSGESAARRPPTFLMHEKKLSTTRALLPLLEDVVRTGSRF